MTSEDKIHNFDYHRNRDENNTFPGNRNSDDVSDDVIEIQVHDPHDRFGCDVIGDSLIAEELFRYYGDPEFAKSLDWKHLSAAPTIQWGPGLKKYISDVIYIVPLLDNSSSVIITIELKSRFTAYVPIQLLVYSSLSVYGDYLEKQKPEVQGPYKPLIPVTILLYTGQKPIPEQIHYQDVFEKIENNTKKYVPQFEILVINLQKNTLEKLQGQPETQACVGALKYGTSGEFASHLEQVLSPFKGFPVTKRISLYVEKICSYCAATNYLTENQLKNAITHTFEGKEGIMLYDSMHSEIIDKGIAIGLVQGIEQGIEQGIAQGIEQGIAQGELKAYISTIICVLEEKFHEKVPADIMEILQQRTDLVAMKSLLVLAVNCQSIKDFGELLK